MRDPREVEAVDFSTRQSGSQRATPGVSRRAGWVATGVTLVFLALTLGCSATNLLQPATPTAPPTRVLSPTFTPTPQALQPLIVVTPPRDGTPGVIIIQPTIEADRIVVAIPPTDTPVPVIINTPSTVLGAVPGAPIVTTPSVPLLPTTTPRPLESLLPGGVPVPEEKATVPGGLIPTATRIPGQPPTETPIPTMTFTPAPTATPFVVVESGYVALRTGPGVEYPLVAQLGPNIPIAIIGRNPEGTWYEICCVNGFSVWVTAASVRVSNGTEQVALVVAQAPPSPTPTFTPTETSTETPTPTVTPYPFEQAIGPQFFPTDNQFLTIWTKLFVGTPPTEDPAPGYCVDVKFEGIDRPNTNVDLPSFDHFEWSAPPGAGNRVQYNNKYEYTPPDPKTLDPNTTDTRATLLGTGNWTIFVTDCAGHQLSNAITFTTNPSNPNREIYVGWVRTR